MWNKKRFLPLPRLIGIYKVIGNIYENPELLEFPAPREVDRYLYKQKKATKAVYLVPIPAPLEIDR